MQLPIQCRHACTCTGVDNCTWNVMQSCWSLQNKSVVEGCLQKIFRLQWLAIRFAYILFLRLHMTYSLECCYGLRPMSVLMSVLEFCNMRDIPPVVSNLNHACLSLQKKTVFVQKSLRYLMLRHTVACVLHIIIHKSDKSLLYKTSSLLSIHDKGV